MEGFRVLELVYYTKAVDTPEPQRSGFLFLQGGNMTEMKHDQIIWQESYLQISRNDLWKQGRFMQ